jgi:hypothetical protein
VVRGKAWWGERRCSGSTVEWTRATGSECTGIGRDRGGAWRLRGGEHGTTPTHGGHAAPDSWGRSATLTSSRLWTLNWRRWIQLRARLIELLRGSITHERVGTRGYRKKGLDRARWDLVTKQLELELKRRGLRDTMHQSRSPRNWNGVSVEPQLKPGFLWLVTH